MSSSSSPPPSPPRGSTAHAAAERLISALLRVPRRACVLAGGDVVDRRDHPGAAEVRVLSELSALARAAAGRPVVPLDGGELLVACLAAPVPPRRKFPDDDDPWQALADDINCGCVDWDAVLGAAAAVAATPASSATAAAALVRRVLDAESHQHLMLACCVLGVVLPQLAEDARGAPLRAALGRELAARLDALLDVLVRHGKFMKREVKDLALTAFGKVLAHGGACPETCADALAFAVRRRQDDLVRLFLHAPLPNDMSRALERTPDLASALLDRAAHCSSVNRYGLLGVLLRVLRAGPAALAAHAPRVADVASGALAAMTTGGAALDSRAALIAALLVQLARPAAADALAFGLARALESSSAALLKTVL